MQRPNALTSRGIHIAVIAAALAAGAVAQVVPPGTAAVTLTLAEAQRRAQANSTDFLAAVTAAQTEVEERKQALDVMLPGVTYNTYYLYTEGNRFIANNGVHEYSSQGNVHEELYNGGLDLATYHHAQAEEALTRAEAEIAGRGLAATVTADYYTLLAAGRKAANAEQALADAQRFLGISQDRERAGDAAHADVIRAQLQRDDRQRALSEAQLEEQKARLELAVLLFPDYDLNFTLQDDLEAEVPLPEKSRIEALAGDHNPQLAAAQANLRAAGADVGAARSSLLPALSLDYWYGIDAPNFATRSPRIIPPGYVEGTTDNLASSAQATLNIPVWNWGASFSKVRQADLRRQLARQELAASQRQLLADLDAGYDEAATARSELATLLESRNDAAESLRLVGLDYQAGEATILELVDAQNANVEARDAYDDGLVRYRIAIAQLQTLTGTF